MATEEQWVRAMRFEPYRQEFINSIDLMEAEPFVSAVFYVPKWSLGGLFNRRTTMKTISRFPKNGHGISTINVYNAAFSGEEHKCLEDFLGALIYHEGHHAKETFERHPDKLDYVEKFNTLALRNMRSHGMELLAGEYRAELRACRNQEANFRKMRFSQQYIDDIERKIRIYESYLQEISLVSPAPRQWSS